MIIRILLVYYYAVLLLLQVLILQQLITLNLGGGEGAERESRFSSNLFVGCFVEGYNSNSGGRGGSGDDGYRRTSSRVRRPIRQRQKSDDSILINTNNNNQNNNNNEPQKQQQQQQHYDDEIKQAQDRHNQALKDPTLLSNSKFIERTDISPKIKRSIIDIMGLQQMTEIQSKTYAAVLKGNCVVGRGRTGTGKTLAFLLPTIERLLAAPLDLYVPGQSIGAVIVAPTRELAIQISKEAETLLTYHEMNVACIYGGTKIQRDIRLLSGTGSGGGSSRLKMPAILVGTPGRILEHMESNTRIRNKRFQDIISDTQIVVLDEADRLFEGFYKDTTKILSYLPRSNKRQTLLFSATIPKGFMKFLKEKMKLQFTYIDCVTNGEEPKSKSQGKSDIVQQQNRLSTSDNKIVGGGKGEETSIRVDQTYYQLQSMDDYITTLVSLIYNHVLDIRDSKKDDKINKNNNVDGCKILVFFPASKLVRFFYQFFHHSGLTEQLLVGGDSSSSCSSMEVLEIHSRMSQSSRQKASNKFRSSSSTTTNTVLFSSDVSARGVDYPNISLVIQYGAPANVDTYIHRLGRTGRAGQQGKGILVLLPFEKDYLKRIKRRLGRTSSSIQPLIRQEHAQDDVPFSFSSLTNNDNTDDSDDDYDSNNHKLIIQNLVKQTQLQIRSGHVVLTPLAVSAYSAFLAYYIASANNKIFSLGKNKKGGGGGGATTKKLKPSQIVDYANQFAICTGLIGPPMLDSKTISRLGIEGLVEVED